MSRDEHVDNLPYERSLRYADCVYSGRVLLYEDIGVIFEDELRCPRCNGELYDRVRFGPGFLGAASDTTRPPDILTAIEAAGDDRLRKLSVPCCCRSEHSGRPSGSEDREGCGEWARIVFEGV
jgi:hypothetical protein